MSRRRRKYRKPAGVFKVTLPMIQSDAELITGIMESILPGPAQQALAELAVGMIITDSNRDKKLELAGIESTMRATQRNLVRLCKLSLDHKETACEIFLSIIYPAVLFFARGYGEDFDLWRFADDFGLAAREKDVIAVASRGLTMKEISSELGISLSSVKHTLGRVFKKTGSRNVIEAIWKLRPSILDSDAPSRIEASARRAFSSALKERRELSRVLLTKSAPLAVCSRKSARVNDSCDETAAIKTIVRSKSKTRDASRPRLLSASTARRN